MRKYLLICALCAVASFAGGAITSQLFTVDRVQAQSDVQVVKSARQGWEYCTVSKTSYAGNITHGYWVSYFRESGVEVVKIEDAATERNGMTKIVAKLGAEGWEMIGPAPLDVRQSAPIEAIYFKRQK